MTANLTRWTMLLVVCAAIAASSCNRDRKAEQLAALERGYAAGVLTQDEYEAKKAMILGTAPAPLSIAKSSVPPPVQEPSTPALVPDTTPPPVQSPPPPQRRPAAVKPAPVSPPPVARPEPVEPPPPPPPVTEPAPPVKEPAAEEPAPLAGCSDGGGKPGKEKGKQERFFPLPLARVREAAIGALEALEFKVNDNSGQQIEATRKRHFGVIGSGGEKMFLRFEPSQENGRRGTLVIGETKKGIIGRVGQKSWTNAVLAQTGCLLRR